MMSGEAVETASGVARSAERLKAAQHQVSTLLSQFRGASWNGHLTSSARAALVGRGHFLAYAHELDWTAREVAGHLRDSAQIFSQRISRLQNDNRPDFADFVTDDQRRLDGYRTQPLPDLLGELYQFQHTLLATVAGVHADQLQHYGRHEIDGEVRLAGILAFLPQHQEDHATQLLTLSEALLSNNRYTA